MITKLHDAIAANQPREVWALIKLMGIVVLDQTYQELIVSELKTLPNFEKSRSLLEAGFFSGDDLVHLVHACGNGSGTNISVLSSLLIRLNEWMLVTDNGLLTPSLRYKWNKDRIALFLTLKILDNALLGPSYVAQKYRQSVPPIFVKKDGNEYTGTGFLVTSRGDARKYVIVTAKHNVDFNDGFQFTSFGSADETTYTPLASKWELHPKLDLALMPVQCSETAIPIYPVSSASILSRTITLGYPRIATTDRPYLLARGGELNASVSNYYGEKSIIISNIVAPGNSGGPVLDEAGLCVGLVVRAFETHHEGGVSAANAAIPSSEVLDFIQPFCM